jgi:hypothetical protein
MIIPVAAHIRAWRGAYWHPALSHRRFHAEGKTR